MNSQFLQNNLHCLLATMGIIMLSSPVAAKVQCAFGEGTYQNVEQPYYKIAFDNKDSGSLTLKTEKTNIKLKVAQWISNGFSRVYIGVGSTIDEAQGDKPFASSVVVHLNADFPPNDAKGEAPYLLMPDIALGLYYSEKFQNLNKNEEALPGDAWKLTGCNNPNAKKGIR